MTIRLFGIALSAICLCAGLTMQVSAQSTIYSEDFKSSDGGYTVNNVGNIQNEWTWAADQGWSVNGNEGGDGNPNNLSQLTSPAITIPASGPVGLSFMHRYSFEQDWDAGAIFTSVNGGDFQQVPTASFTSNGYTKQGLLGEHDLNGGAGFNGNTAGFSEGTLISTTADLGTYNEGDNLQIQFYGAWDQFTIGALSPPEWHVDSVQVTAVPEPSTLGLVVVGLLPLVGLRRRRHTRT